MLIAYLNSGANTAPELEKTLQGPPGLWGRRGQHQEVYGGHPDRGILVLIARSKKDSRLSVARAAAGRITPTAKTSPMAPAAEIPHLI